MTDLEIHHIDASWIAVTTEDPGIKEDLYQFFRYKEPTFTPNKFSKWDGDVRLYDKRTGKISYGLFSTILQFAKDRGLSVKVDDAIKSDLKPVTQEEINSWVDSLDIRNAKGEKLDPYDYQREGLYLSIKYSRMTLLAATSAGKSLLIYMIIRFLSLTTPGKILLVVPSINLVTQMKKDFGEYSMNDDGWNVDEECHEVYDGRSPYTSKKVVISTWQSLKDLDAGFFHPFTVMIGDECHTFSGACLEQIGKNCINAYNRVGLTGTLKKEKLHPLQVQQHFGPVKRIVTTKQLQDAGRASKTQVTMIQIEHSAETRKEIYDSKAYDKEIELLIGNKFRNRIIKGLASSLKGNTIMLFDRVEKHLDIIAEELKAEIGDRKKVLVISGDVKNADRDTIKALMEEEDGIVLLASYGTMSTGVSIKRLHNLVFCHPSKSIIRILQSLGRTLRLHESKEVANIYDLVDIALYMERPNFAMTHAAERLGFYQEEEHPVTSKKFNAPQGPSTTTTLV